MAYAEKFEDLLAWQKARELCNLVFQKTENPKFAKDYDFRSQLRRAAISAMANIAEGFERGNKGDFHRFLSIAKASAGEVRSHLYIAHDIGYLNDADFQLLFEQAVELGRIIGALRVSVYQKWRAEK
jgi:four helix bundle protein